MNPGTATLPISQPTALIFNSRQSMNIKDLIGMRLILSSFLAVYLTACGGGGGYALFLAAGDYNLIAVVTDLGDLGF